MNIQKKAKINKFRFSGFVFIAMFLLASFLFSQNIDKTDWEGNYPDGCTTILVGKKASADGSTTTSHTCDSHRTRAWIDIVPAKDHKKGAKDEMVKRMKDDDQVMPAYKHPKVGEIPQVKHTNGYINTAYPAMNDHQLAVGESTFGGRECLFSENGLIDCQQLNTLMLERCTTAREAIKLAGEFTKKYGWIDVGECLTIADKKEVWAFEIVGPGKGKMGSIWAAQRVPDDHVYVNGNGSRIRQIDLNNPDYFMASDNIFKVAQDSGWWNPNNGTFEFCYAYSPESRTSMATRRREWRAFDLMAPSLKLHPNDENYPFSVKPDTLVTLQKLVDIFKDYYEGTDYNFVKDITWTNKEGKTEISPMANPFMPYDMNKIFKINGGWSWRGERTIARWYTMYATITQSRDWLPDEIGGVVWLAMDNVASSIYIPVYCSVTDMPAPYKVHGRKTGYNRESAWWVFNRLGTLAAQRWGDMRHDLDAVWLPMQTEIFNKQAEIEKEVMKKLRGKRRDTKGARKFLTEYTNMWGNKVVKEALKLGDGLWTKYDEKF